MSDSLQFLAQHGALILFAAVFAEQLGVPLPSAPFLLAAGALMGAGKLNPVTALLAAGLGSLMADILWFLIGRSHGRRALGLLCRISLEPDTCIQRTQSLYSRNGPKALIFGKFIPGLSMVLPPLAATTGITLTTFLVYDAVSSFLYTGVFTLVGYLFSNQIERVLRALSRFGLGALGILLGLLAIYIGVKYLQRRRLFYSLRMARISAETLRQMQESGDNVFVVDLRPGRALGKDAVRIAGALTLDPRELEARHGEIPRDRDVVLYCDCPNEATAARTALMLRKRGITRVRPLEGGIGTWQIRQYPLEPYFAALQTPAK